MAWPRSTAGQCMPSGAHTAVTHPRAHTGTYRYMSSKQLNSRATSPFKEIEEVDQENSPKPRQKHFKSKTLGFSVPAGIDVEQRALIPLKDGKPNAVQALSLREASDRRGVTTHVQKEIVNNTQKESAKSAALQVAARAARDQASTLAKLGSLLQLLLLLQSLACTGMWLSFALVDMLC